MADLNFENFHTGNEVETEIDYQTIANSCIVDLSEQLAHPEILLSIGKHEYKGNWYPTPLMTSGEFSAIIATSKAKKTFLKSAFLGCYIRNNNDNGNLFPNIISHRDQDYTVLDFDTEQGKYYTQRTFRRVQEISGFRYDNYIGYATRHLTSNQRLGLIDWCLKNQSTLYNTPVKLLSIDGIADLVENTNDIVMSKEASDYILRWTYEYNIHITTIIHKSGQTGKPLGHLGTYILKKGENVIDLNINEDNSITVTNPFSRGYRFDAFTFDVNKDSLPYLIENY